jgi:DNA-binding NarL/FixJ family response regulator
MVVSGDAQADGRRNHPAVEPQRSKPRGRPRDRYPSQQQQRVLGLVASGLTTKEIGARLHVSDACVKKHIGKLIARYGATNRASLIAAVFTADHASLAIAAPDGRVPIAIRLPGDQGTETKRPASE